MADPSPLQAVDLLSLNEKAIRVICAKTALRRNCDVKKKIPAWHKISCV